MENKVKAEINIEGKPIPAFSSFNLYQRFNEHHTFELRFNQDQIELPGPISLNRSKDFIGKSISIEFGAQPAPGNRFSGIITKVEIAQSHGLMGDIILTGFSPTILIDRGPDLGSYLGKSLKTIIDQATKEVPANDLYMKVKPSRTSPVDYLIQYRESDFEFINRLAAQYHEWFFYDGTALVFGKPDELKEVKLIYGRDLSNIQYGIQIAPLKYKKFAYNPAQDELLSANGEGQSSGPPDMAHAIAASNTVYSKAFNQPLVTRADNKMEIDVFVKNEQASLISGLLHINGTGDNPQVALGNIVDISMSTRKLNDFSIEDFGKFLVTSVYHHIDGVGHYQNSFEAVSADTERVPVNPAQKPQPDIQLANVIDNNDPSGHGRVKVKFKWECGCNDVTEWLRVLTPDAGSSEKVSKNRGFVFIPEIGDQVVVAFEEGNIARPIVMGSVFHGKSGSGGSASNNSKSITSKSGHTVQLNDGGGITIKDKTGGNHIIVDGENKVTVTSTQTIILSNGTSAITLQNDKITIHADQIEIAQKNGGKSSKIDINGTATNINTEDMVITSTNNTISGKNYITGGDTTIDMGDVFIN
ncbi:type VI secretion system Vgr family protein [Pedobacter cryoconitis]|uniref:Uncharacterized protein involved in type VI secretion and phage assembly n=1 Tax=Pedobacter cryoconitis TaxID=188932 RepID=A0A7X0J2I4_9SPHI|nr:phage baseplate assembly protein V [Pedobacter cryoconitis]MBB6499896.1 uncharacterized protein involved in type VI secretion and phage assembly [Pedobacter cryoconitis]